MLIETNPSSFTSISMDLSLVLDSLKELVSKDPAVQAYMRSIHEKSERMDDTDRDIESGEDVAADHVADDISASYSA